MKPEQKERPESNHWPITIATWTPFVFFLLFSQTDQGSAIFFLLLVFPGLLFGAWTLWRRRLAEQRIEDERAQQLLAALRNGERPRFVLYLRPFTTDRLERAWTLKDDRDTYGLHRRPLDDELNYLVQDHGLLVAISQRRLRPGAATVTSSDDDWERDFKLLAQSAAALVMVLPVSTRGARLELRAILTNNLLLNKTIFFHLPHGPRDDDWEKMRAAHPLLAEHCRDSGGTYMFSPRGHYPLPAPDDAELALYFEGLSGLGRLRTIGASSHIRVNWPPPPPPASGADPAGR